MADHSITLTFIGGTPGVVHLHLGDSTVLDTTELVNAVTGIETVGASVVEVLNRVVAELHAMTEAAGNSVDPAAVHNLADRLEAQADAIAAAVATVPPPPAPPA